MRASRGLPAPTLVTRWEGLREHMDRVPAGKSPLEAMDGALEDAARAWQRDVHGLTLQAGDLIVKHRNGCLAQALDGTGNLLPDDP